MGFGKPDNGKKKVVDRKFDLLRKASLAPLILWPFTVFTSIFLFDNPDAAGNVSTWIVFIALTCYPIVFVGNACLARRLYSRRRKAAYGLVLWPLVLSGVAVLLLALWVALGG